MSGYVRGTSTVFELLVIGAIIAGVALAIAYGISWDINRHRQRAFEPRLGYAEFRK